MTIKSVSKRNYGKGRTWEDRFWSRVSNRTTTNKCWAWQAGLNRDGYGEITIEGKHHLLVHRVSWYLSTGQWPLGIIRHTCDKPKCVNPSHLLEGTHTDNVRDKVERNRQQRGESVPNSILKENQVREIRELSTKGTSLTNIALRYGVSISNIARIRDGHTWRHVT